MKTGELGEVGELVKAGEVEELGYDQHMAIATVKAPAAAPNHQIQLSTLADQLT